MAFAFFEGASLGHFVRAILEIDPKILFVAFSATTAIFAAFTGSALFAQKRSYLFLGGFLGSALSLMCWLSFLNIFFRRFEKVY